MPAIRSMFDPQAHHLIQRAGKSPCYQGWPRLDRAQLNDLLAQSGEFGLVCGEIGVIDVDVDKSTHQPSQETIEALLALELPETLKVQTPSGGTHYFFWNRSGLELRRRIRIAPGIDWLGAGGYVALYAPLDQYQDDMINGLPESVIELVSAPAEPEGPGLMAPGNRNVTLASMAGQLMRQGVAPQDAFDQLRGINAVIPQPLPVVEVARTVASVARYHPEPVPLPAVAWPFATLNQIAQIDLPPQVPIIGPFQTASVVILAATRGTGKTGLITQIAQAVASGQAFCEWQVTAPGPVAFVQLDMGVHRVKKRAIGRQWHNDFHYVTRWQFQRAGMPIPDLGEPSHHDAIIEQLGNYRMVIFDTRRACQPPGGSGQGANLWHPSYWLASAPVRYALTDRGCCVVFVDHLTNTGEVKDTKAIEDDADTVIAIRDSDKGTADTCFSFELTKDRDNIASGSMYFEFTDLNTWRSWTDQSLKFDVAEYRMDHTIAETAEEFNVSERTVRNYCRDRRREIRATNQGE